MKKIMITFEENRYGTGPFQSHQRIINSKLNEKYVLCPLIIKRYKRDFFRIKMFRNLVNQIKSENPDLVHIHGLQIVGFICSLAAKKCKKKIVLAVRGSSLESLSISKTKKSVLKFMEKRTLLMATTIYCVSNYVSSWDCLMPFRNKVFGTIYNMGSEDSLVSTVSRDLLGIKNDDIVIVTSGRITEEKGFDVFLRLIDYYKNNEKIKFLVMGSGDYLDHMKNFINDNNINSTMLLGYVSNVMDYLKISDVFIICTKHETFCNSIVEAMSSSLPIIAPNVGGIPELVENGYNGYLYDVSNEKQLFQVSKELIYNNNLMRELGNNSKKKYDLKFSKEVIISQIDKMYQEIL